MPMQTIDVGGHVLAGVVRFEPKASCSPKRGVRNRREQKLLADCCAVPMTHVTDQTAREWPE